MSSDELRVHLSVPTDNVVINNTHSYSSRYQRIHTFPDDREHEREGEEGEYQEPSALLRPRDQRDSTGRTHTWPELDAMCNVCKTRRVRQSKDWKRTHC